jgi:hypothetical protein
MPVPGTNDPGAGPLDPQLIASAFARPEFAEEYDAARPRPPEVLLNVLCRYARAPRPRLVKAVIRPGSGERVDCNPWRIGR